MTKEQREKALKEYEAMTQYEQEQHHQEIRKELIDKGLIKPVEVKK